MQTSRVFELVTSHTIRTVHHTQRRFMVSSPQGNDGVRDGRQVGLSDTESETDTVHRSRGGSHIRCPLYRAHVSRAVRLVFVCVCARHTHTHTNIFT